RHGRRTARASRALLFAGCQRRRGARLARNGCLVRGIPRTYSRRRRPRADRLRTVGTRNPRFHPKPWLTPLPHARSRVSRWKLMYVLYEDSGNFKAEKIFSQSDSTMQVESESGKRSKIKNASVLFSFDGPAPAALLEEAHALAQTFEIDFLWECAPQDEFDAVTFGTDYFGHQPSAVEKAALIFALNSAPAYFHRRGKGRYRPAPPDILAAALAAIEKKRLQAEQQQKWTDQLLAGELPPEIAQVATSLLPDR